MEETCVTTAASGLASEGTELELIAADEYVQQRKKLYEEYRRLRAVRPQFARPQFNPRATSSPLFISGFAILLSAALIYACWQGLVNTLDECIIAAAAFSTSVAGHFVIRFRSWEFGPGFLYTALVIPVSTVSGFVLGIYTEPFSKSELGGISMLCAVILLWCIVIRLLAQCDVLDFGRNSEVVFLLMSISVVAAVSMIARSWVPLSVVPAVIVVAALLVIIFHDSWNYEVLGSQVALNPI